LPLGIHNTLPADIGDVILTRRCSIEAPDGEVGPLILSVMRPVTDDEGDVHQSMRLECRHFDKTVTVAAGDDIQAMTLVLYMGHVQLQRVTRDGFSVWWHEKGDFGFFDFWSYQERPSEYCLQSAYEGAVLEAFVQATEGQFLMPSHRVAIEVDRPAITTYAVQPDGTDVVDGLIRPDDLPGLSPDELCRRLGRIILNRSEEGRQLLANQRQPEP
jgi:hypothetical protein